MIMQVQLLTNCLRTNYGIEVANLTSLNVGADVNACIVKVQASDQKNYFVKLKRGPVPDALVAVLELLTTAGLEHVILPIKTVAGKDIHRTEDVSMIVYPFIYGHDGFAGSLRDEQWIALGRALRRVHEINVPKEERRIRREEFSPKWRNTVSLLFRDHQTAWANDSLALEFCQFLTHKRAVIEQMVERSLKLSQKIRTKPRSFVLCHSDIHGGNVLLGERAFYLVDWDAPILAPKERDLMFIGGGVGNVWNKPHEERLFYQGYGHVEIDCDLLAYYRNERIVEDIAEYGQELLLNPCKDKDREEMYRQFVGMFAPQGVVDIAIAT